MTVTGSADTATQVLAMQQQALQGRMATAMLRRQAQEQQQFASMLDAALKAAPAPGTGTRVDLSV